MKKFYSISILLLLVFNTIGILVVFKIQQSKIRADIKDQIKAGVPREDLHEFVMSQKGYKILEWVRPELEFRVGEEMFDIVDFEQFNDSIRLLCVNDTEEALLFVHLKELIQKKINQESNEPNSPMAQVIKACKLVYISQINDLIIQTYSSRETNLCIEIIDDYQSPFIEIHLPPPEVV